MRIDHAGPSDVSFVATYLRERNRIEAAALLGTQYEAQLIQRYSAGGYVMAEGRTPIAIFALSEARRGVMSVSLFATDDFPRIARPATHYLARRLFPALRRRCHRIECLSIGEYEDTRRWLQAFGLTPEAKLRSYGCGGEDFTLYAWAREAGATSVVCDMT